MEENPILYLDSLLILIVLLWFYLRIWPKTVVASSRQHLFELRDRLFNLALDERISFSDPIYRELREQLNRSLRFTHKLTFFTFLLAIKSYSGPLPDNLLVLTRNIDKLENIGLRKELQTIYNRMGFVLLEQMFKRSPIAFVLLTVYLFFSISIPFSERLKETKSRLLTLLSSKTADRAFASASSSG